MAPQTSLIDAQAKSLMLEYAADLPRYTSYPTAPHFSDEYQVENYLDDTRRSNEALLPRPLSVYVHIPFCHSMCHFCGCTKIVTGPHNPKVAHYQDLLRKEIALRAPLFDRDREVEQIHFGGGTPNFLKPQKLKQIVDALRANFSMSSDSPPEMGIEVDPRATNAAGIRELSEIGFNRFSIGVQDFSMPVQHAINRVQCSYATLDVIKAAKEVSGQVNIDLIVGLPKQTRTSFNETLDAVIEAGVSRIAVYQFAYLPQRIRAQRLINPDDLPSAEARIELVFMTRQRLLDAGYVAIGMDHYALPFDALSQAAKSNRLQRNFQGYTTHADTDLIGLGVSAISQFKWAFAQNTTKLSEYGAHLEAGQLPIKRGKQLSADDMLRAHIVQEIMCRDSIDFARRVSAIDAAPSSANLAEYFRHDLAQLQPFIDDGLVAYANGALTVLPLGQYFRRHIAAKFDAYLATSKEHNNIRRLTSQKAKEIGEAHENVVKFSKTI